MDRINLVIRYGFSVKVRDFHADDTAAGNAAIRTEA
jgi:hypothetical protein